MTIIDVACLVSIFQNFDASCGQPLEYNNNISGNGFAIKIIVFVADSLNVLLRPLVRFNNLCRRGFVSTMLAAIIGDSVDESFPRNSLSHTDANKWFQFFGYLCGQRI